MAGAAILRALAAALALAAPAARPCAGPLAAAGVGRADPGLRVEEDVARAFAAARAKGALVLVDVWAPW